MITNDSRVRYRMVRLMCQIDHLPTAEQGKFIAAELERAHAAGELSKPAELVGGKWQLHIAADARPIKIDIKLCTDDETAETLKHIFKENNS